MTLDARDQRAILIAATQRFDRKNGAWLVPSQSDGGKTYTVTLEGKKKDVRAEQAELMPEPVPEPITVEAAAPATPPVRQYRRMAAIVE